MNIERLQKIMKYSDSHRNDMETKVKDFYAVAGMSSDKEILNILQVVRPIVRKIGYFVFELPLADEEIGALCYKGDGMGYLVLNTSLPKVNVHFATAHEMYHIVYQTTEFQSKVEFAAEHYSEEEEELAANLFAGMLLMPESGFRLMYNKFKEESEGNEKDTIIRLMHYYQVPYMAALVRCYALGLPKTNHVSEELLNLDRNRIKRRCNELWLDDSILNATKKDDYICIQDFVRRMGEKYIRESYLNEKTLDKVFQNMQKLYSEIKGE